MKLIWILVVIISLLPLAFTGLAFSKLVKALSLSVSGQKIQAEVSSFRDVYCIGRDLHYRRDYTYPCFAANLTYVLNGKSYYVESELKSDQPNKIGTKITVLVAPMFPTDFAASSFELLWLRPIFEFLLGFFFIIVLYKIIIFLMPLDLKRRLLNNINTN